MIEFWYEFASTYSYPAAMRVSDLADNAGVQVQWRPFLLGPIFQELGWATSPFNLQPAKGAYMWRDLERTCDGLHLPFVRPTEFPQNGLLAARIAIAFPNNDHRAAFSKAVYQAQFAQGKAISDPNVLSEILTDMGQDALAIMEHAQTFQVKEALRDATDTARKHGIFGAPSWRTKDGELFWGNDRLIEAIAWTKLQAS